MQTRNYARALARVGSQGLVSLAAIAVAMHGASAQSYPSPTFNNLTILGTLTGPGGYAHTQTGASYTYQASDSYTCVLRSNSGAAMEDTLPSSGLSAGAQICIKNADSSGLLAVHAASGASLDGASGGYVILGPGQSLMIAAQNSTTFKAINKPDRTVLGAGSTIYMATSGAGGSDTNDCITVATACATLQSVYNRLVASWDMANNDLTVQLENGTYTAGLFANGKITGQLGNAAVVFQGSTSDATQVIVDSATTTEADFMAVQQANFYVQWMTLHSSTVNGLSLLGADTGGVTGGGNLIFGSVIGAAQIKSQEGFGFIRIGGPITVTGGGEALAYAGDTGETFLSSTITFANPVTYTMGTLWAGPGGQIVGPNSWTNGSNVTGPKFNFQGGAIINTDCSQIPGTTAGLLTATSWCYGINNEPTWQQWTPGGPSGTTSTSAVMMGLGLTFSPNSSGIFTAHIDGQMKNATTTDGCFAYIVIGHGTAPSNGAAEPGGSINVTQASLHLPTGTATQFSQSGMVASGSALSQGTTYWMDLALGAVTGGTCSMLNINAYVQEKPW